MISAIQKAKQFVGTTVDSATAAGKKAVATVKEHVPTADQLRDVRDGAIETAGSIAETVKELVQEIVESKPFRDGAKGAIVGAAVAVPVPFVGPLFGGVLGAAVAMYFGHQTGGSRTVTVEVPAEGSEAYVLLRELDDLRKRKILTRAQFEARVQQVLDSFQESNSKKHAVETPLKPAAGTRPIKATRQRLPGVRQSSQSPKNR